MSRCNRVPTCISIYNLWALFPEAKCRTNVSKLSICLLISMYMYMYIYIYHSNTYAFCIHSCGLWYCAFTWNPGGLDFHLPPDDRLLWSLPWNWWKQTEPWHVRRNWGGLGMVAGGRYTPKVWRMEPENDGFQSRNLLFQGLIFRWTMLNYRGRCQEFSSQVIQKYHDESITCGTHGLPFSFSYFNLKTIS